MKNSGIAAQGGLAAGILLLAGASFSGCSDNQARDAYALNGGPKAEPLRQAELPNSSRIAPDRSWIPTSVSQHQLYLGTIDQHVASLSQGINLKFARGKSLDDVSNAFAAAGQDAVITAMFDKWRVENGAHSLSGLDREQRIIVSYVLQFALSKGIEEQRNHIQKLLQTPGGDRYANNFVDIRPFTIDGVWGGQSQTAMSSFQSNARWLANAGEKIAPLKVSHIGEQGADSTGLSPGTLAVLESYCSALRAVTSPDNFLVVYCTSGMRAGMEPGKISPPTHYSPANWLYSLAHPQNELPVGHYVTQPSAVAMLGQYFSHSQGVPRTIY